jgi:hypothetical protein
VCAGSRSAAAAALALRGSSTAIFLGRGRDPQCKAIAPPKKKSSSSAPLTQVVMEVGALMEEPATPAAASNAMRPSLPPFDPTAMRRAHRSFTARPQSQFDFGSPLFAALAGSCCMSRTELLKRATQAVCELAEFDARAENVHDLGLGGTMRAAANSVAAEVNSEALRVDRAAVRQWEYERLCRQYPFILDFDIEEYVRRCEAKGDWQVAVCACVHELCCRIFVPVPTLSTL